MHGGVEVSIAEFVAEAKAGWLLFRQPEFHEHN
jgi:hypothetical protein